MLRKLIIFALTSGLAAKAYRHYANKREAGAEPVAERQPVRRKAGTSA